MKDNSVPLPECSGAELSALPRWVHPVRAL